MTTTQTAVIITAIALAAAALLFGPDYLDRRRAENTPLCIGDLSYVQAQQYGCRLR